MAGKICIELVRNSRINVSHKDAKAQRKRQYLLSKSLIISAFATILTNLKTKIIVIAIFYADTLPRN